MPLRTALWVLVLLVAGCANAVGTATSVPTQALIPSTLTDTPIPVTPTETRLPLPAASDLLTPTAVVEASVIVPARAQPLMAMVRGDLARALDLSEETVQVVRVEEAQWDNVDLGCGGDRLPQVLLNVDGFRVVLAVNGDEYEYHTDLIDRFRLCNQPSVDEIETLLPADPIAGELALLAQARLAEALDLPRRRVRLVAVTAYIWPDTSLGCPTPGNTYTAQAIDGYRIELSVGDTAYFFHSDSDRVVVCEPANEVLPETSG
jgi:hypothetical protein